MYLPSFYTIVLRLPMHILSPFLNSFAVNVFIPRISTALRIYVVNQMALVHCSKPCGFPSHPKKNLNSFL